MSEIIMSETEKQQFTEFKRKLGLQAAQAQVNKIEYNLCDAAVEKGTLRRACQDANVLKLGGICVLPALVKPCAAFLGSNRKTLLIACISFPHGGDSLKTKKSAIKNAVKDGADEVEVTIPVSYLKDGNLAYIRREFKKLKRSAGKKTVRINIESALLVPQEITRVCALAADCGITSLRSSSGAYGGGFDGETIMRMKSAVKDKCIIKADGVTNIADMNTAVDMGAGVIGCKNASDLARMILQTAEN